MEEVYCNICEELVGEADSIDGVGGLEEVALWNGGHTGDIAGATVVCNGCVTYGYDLMMKLKEKRKNES